MNAAKVTKNSYLDAEVVLPAGVEIEPEEAGYREDTLRLRLTRKLVPGTVKALRELADALESGLGMKLEE